LTRIDGAIAIRAAPLAAGPAKSPLIPTRSSSMKLAAVLCGAALSLFAVVAPAQDAMKKDAMKDGAMTKEMTLQQCKDHMAMAKKDDMKKDDATMKKDAMCADMMKKDGMMKKDDAMMKKDGMAAEPMKK
jgi:hypothetical protein